MVALFVGMLLCQASSSELIDQARAALAKRDLPVALERATQAIAADPKNKLGYLVRALIREAGDDFAGADADWTQYLRIDPKDADALQSRGCIRFKAGRFKDSVADFDEHIRIRPERLASHWQRGISCYYAGLYDEGRKQFEGYQEFDDADVENAIWRFMCMTKSDGLEKARKAMLKIGDDKRVPMRNIYELYAGRQSPDDVLKAAKATDPTKRKLALFYAHLYLGVWYDLVGQPKKALEHLEQAVRDYRIGHYMGDVARVHRDLLKSAPAKD